MAFIEPKTGNIARIKVIGVGGGGQNAVSTMVNLGKIEGVEFIAMNTDLQALNSSSAEIRLQLGPEITRGLGSGADPHIGHESAIESVEEIKSHIGGSDMVFIASCFGGGTGSGASPIVAKISKDLGALTIGVVTKPFEFEGKRRMNQAEQALRDLRDKVDALIVIPNQKLLEVVEENVPLRDAFKVSDQVISQAVEGISDLITSTGLVNVDFADVKTIMTNAGSALMGIGIDDGENRAEKAAELAINSPLLDVDIKGSTGILINIVGDPNMTMHEVNKAAKVITDAAHESANIIFGANIDEELEGIKITVIATGFDSDFKSVGVPEYASLSDQELLDQIDSRFDYQNVKSDSKDDKKEDTEEQISESNEIKVEIEDSTSDSDFDIRKMREEIRKMDEEEKTDKPKVEAQKTDKSEEGKKKSELPKSTGFTTSSSKPSTDKKDEKENDKEENDSDEDGRSGSIWRLISTRS